MLKKHFHRILLTLFFCAILFPLLFQSFNIKDIYKLKGAFVPAPMPDFSFANYFDEKFQPEYEKYWNEHFGERSFFVRLHNQMMFSLFDKSLVNGVDIGKDNYLYETAYINAVYGIDFIGNDSIRNNCNKLKIISDSLAKHGCGLLVVLAAGKGSFYPEYIPEKYQPSGNPTNHETYVKHLAQQGVDFIDFSSWMIKNKQTSQYVLYPKTGIHWSYYTMVNVADSITRFIEKKLNLDIPDIVIDSIEVKDGFEDTDADIEEAQNLFFPIKKPLMAYPRFHYVTENRSKPRVVVISDSFYWAMFSAGFNDNVFNDGKFWYYFKEIYPDHFNNPTLISSINLKDELAKTDMVILLSNEPNLNHLGWGFIEDAYSMYTDNGTFTKNQRIKQLEEIIRNNPGWFEEVKKKAKDWGMDLDEVIHRDAVWMYDNENATKTQ